MAKDSVLANKGFTQCRNSTFYWGSKTYVMGIINLSDDSFSGDGNDDIESALQKAESMVKEGADIIDVGAESTRPDAIPISFREELDKVIPFIAEAEKRLNVPISVDTYKYEVAKQALEAGANILNDISGLKRSPELINLAAEHKIPIILTSNQRDKPVLDIMTSSAGDFEVLIETALKAGVLWEHIILDPGIGFGKTQAQNLEILGRLNEFQLFNRPILIGTSRKSVIGNVLNLPATNRLEGTAATIAISISKGVDIVRVHDVKQMILVCKMSDAITRRD